MGRKQKLREEKKRSIKNNPPSAAVTTAAISTATATATATATTAAAISTALPSGNDYSDYLIYLDREFPVSDEYAQVVANIDNIENREIFELCKRGDVEHNCVHSMHGMGKFMLMDGPDRKVFALSYFMRGAIRGSCQCALKLIGDSSYKPAEALKDYWAKMLVEYGYDIKLDIKGHKERVLRECVICSKTDTKRRTLQQCKGCSYYCYCSEICQTIHWDTYNHSGECRQLGILNKYHKPYAKEIRDAIIRGDTDTDILALEKLRIKLGFDRYQSQEELARRIDPFIHDGIVPNDRRIFRAARRNGKVII
jgi:hypothetical protein